MFLWKQNAFIFLFSGQINLLISKFEKQQHIFKAVLETFIWW